MTTKSPNSLPHRLLLFGATALLLGTVGRALSRVEAEIESSPCRPCCITARELSRMEPCQLDELFAQGQVGAWPVGLGRGRVLYVVTASRPRLRAHLNGVVWKGKYLYSDGQFTNQWLCFRAISSHVTIGPSWYDGKPCFVLEYPPGTAVFGNARDELREIASGVILGRFYERCPCPKLQGYFVLEMTESEEHKGNCR